MSGSEIQATFNPHSHLLSDWMCVLMSEMVRWGGVVRTPMWLEEGGAVGMEGPRGGGGKL